MYLWGKTLFKVLHPHNHTEPLVSIMWDLQINMEELTRSWPLGFTCGNVVNFLIYSCLLGFGEEFYSFYDTGYTCFLLGLLWTCFCLLQLWKGHFSCYILGLVISTRKFHLLSNKPLCYISQIKIYKNFMTYIF